MSRAWTREELEATVADYFHMLTLDLAGQHYNKAAHNRALLQKLEDRTRGAVELKHQNISAILIQLGYPYISGYKPLGNYQFLLFDVVADRCKTDEQLDRTALAAVQMPAEVPLMQSFNGLLVDAPARSHSIKEKPAPNYQWQTKQTIKRDYISREAQNQSLGRAGEEFVLEFERWRLVTAGHEKLAEKVEHIANTRGDGLGFDILSFETSGKDRLIEVKTTSFGKETPFFITKYEVDFSRSQSDIFHLYRVFDFRKEPRIFSLKGAVEKNCHLDPTTYQATFS